MLSDLEPQLREDSPLYHDALRISIKTPSFYRHDVFLVDEDDDVEFKEHPQYRLVNELPKIHRALVGDDNVRDSDVTLALQGFLHHKTRILLPHLTTPTVDMLLMVSELY